MNKCSCCKKTINILSPGELLPDGTTLCGKCYRQIPTSLQNYVLMKGNSQMVGDLLAFTSYSRTHLIKQYTETFRVGALSIDQNHLLYKFDRTIFDMHYLEGFELNFLPIQKIKTIKGIRAEGKLTIKLKSIKPVFETVLVINEFSKAKGVMNNGTFEYRMPDEAIQIQSIFANCFNILAEEKAAKERLYHKNHSQQKTEYRTTGAGHQKASSSNTNRNNTTNNNTKSNSNDTKSNYNATKPDNKYEKSLSLFMIDDMNNVTLSELKKQRNRLIKAFHPDGNDINEEYAQKINEAFEILKKYAKEG